MIGIKNRAILENISANLFIRLITYAFSFLTVFYSARVLQPEAYGKMAFVSSFTGYFIMLANLGMPIYAMRLCAEMKDDRKELSRVTNELWSIGVILSVLSLTVFLVMVVAIPGLREDRLLFFIYGSGVVFQLFGFEWLFKGLERFKFLAFCQMASKAVSFLCMLLFIRSGEQLPLYAMLSVAAAYGSNVICFFAVRKHVDLSLRIRFNKIHLKPLFIFFLMSCAVSVYSSLDLTMMGFMKMGPDMGLYSVAARGKDVLTLLGGIVWMSILPRATQLWKEGKKDSFEALARKSLTVVAFIQFLVTLICFIFAREIVVIIGGEAYGEAAPAFRILLLSLIPIGISNILGGQVLIPAGGERYLLYAEITGALINFSTNLFIIPLFSIEGAAATTVISEIVVTLICLYFVKRKLQMDFGFSLIRKVVLWSAGIIKRDFICLNGRIQKGKLPYYCPCCGTYLKKYVDGGYRNMPDRVDTLRYAYIEQDVLCPVCRAMPRHRILAYWCDGKREELSKSKILYFAPEYSMSRWMKRNGIICTTADLSADADLRIDIQDTGITEGSYDVVVCNHVLEHVDDFRKALKEIHRILRPGGSFICSFPMDPMIEFLDEDPHIQTDEERRRRFGQTDHKRVFGMKADRFLSEAGFTVEKIKGEACSDIILPVIGPADYDMNILFHCKKNKRCGSNNV